MASGANGAAGWFDPQSDALCVTGSGHEARLYFAGRGKSRHQIRRQFLASVAGILVSFMATALLMTVLRLTNQALGWDPVSESVVHWRHGTGDADVQRQPVRVV